MNSDVSRQYHFADFVLNETRGALLRGEEEIPLRRQAYEMLVILVVHAGELVSRDFLMDTIWRGSVVTENSITQCLKEIRHAIGDHDLSMIRTIPRRGYIFELPVETPGTRTTAAAEVATPRRWLAGAAIAITLAAFAWWALDRAPTAEQITPSGATPPPSSLAVLPFVNMSPDRDISFLADGVSEEILNQLAQIPDLLVIARTSSFTFRDQDLDIAAIGQQLNVAHVLEGSVRVEDNAARITAQLIRTDNQAHFWSQSYDRPLDSIFELQKSIARDVARQLHFQLKLADADEAKPAHKPKPEAYESYLRGKYLMAQRTNQSMAGAVAEFHRAVEIDPDFAAAHAGLALATRFQSETQYGSLTEAEALARARPHAERALELDPQSAEAHAAMGYSLLSWESSDQAIQYFRRAVALNPNYSDGAMWLSSFLVDRGEYQESFELLQSAVRADPLSRVAWWNYASSLLDLGRIEDAEQAMEKTASLWPAPHRDLIIRKQTRGGQWAEGALAALEARLEFPDDWRLKVSFGSLIAAMGLGGDAPTFTAVTHPLYYELLGRPQVIVQGYESLQEEKGLRPAQEWILGEALAATGEFEQALAYLENKWELMNGTVAMPWFGARSVLALIGTRTAVGIVSGTDALVAALQQSARRYREAGLVYCELSGCVDFETGIAAYLSGDRNSAVALLTKAVSSGYLIPPDFAYLQVLYDDPDLAPVFERQRAHLLRERAEFLETICADNPYADLWQPEEGTCTAFLPDRFSAASQAKPGR